MFFQSFSTLLFTFFRSYFVRRIRDGFRESQHLSDDPDLIKDRIGFAEQNLQIIKRQVRGRAKTNAKL